MHGLLQKADSGETSRDFEERAKMRDPNRIDRICNELAKLWKQNPDWRFGQLIENLYGCPANHKRCVFHIEDEETEAKIQSAIGDSKT
jgi:hypothetical protein